MVKVETNMSFRPFAISLRTSPSYSTIFLPWALMDVAFTAKKTLQPLVESASLAKRLSFRPRSRCFLIKGSLLTSKFPNSAPCMTTSSTPSSLTEHIKNAERKLLENAVSV